MEELLKRRGGGWANSKGRKSLETLRPFSLGRTWGIVQGVVLVDVDLGIHVVLFSCFMSGILECFSLTSFVGTDARIWDIWAFYSGSLDNAFKRKPSFFANRLWRQYVGGRKSVWAIHHWSRYRHIARSDKKEFGLGRSLSKHMYVPYQCHVRKSDHFEIQKRKKKVDHDQKFIFSHVDISSFSEIF